VCLSQPGRYAFPQTPDVSTIRAFLLRQTCPMGVCVNDVTRRNTACRARVTPSWLVSLIAR
jgi:hypothetical protein